MKFKPSLSTHEFTESVYKTVRARNKAVIGRSGLFLALGEGVPEDFRPKDAQGVELDDDTVVPDELRDVVRAALNHRAGRKLDENGYRQEFRRHYDWGGQRLKRMWENCGNDPVHFVTELLHVCGEDFIGSGGRTAPVGKPMSVIEAEVKLKVLVDAPDWSMNGPGTSNGLLVISGQPGSGKSQLALDLLAQLANHGVRFVFFDMKGELEDDPNNPQQRKKHAQFLEQTGARYVRLIRQDLPINPLLRDPNPTVNAKIAYGIAGLIRAFAPQLGAKQEQNIADVYQSLASPDFVSLVHGLEKIGATGVDLAIVKKIVDFNLFASTHTAISADEWLSSSIVVDFKEFGTDNDTKSLAVALILNFLIRKLSQQLSIKNDIQPLKMVLFIDEAHLLLPKEHKAGLLGQLARQGRSWGFPVWLASQDADKFLATGTNETNFAALAECGVHFSPQTMNSTDQKMILGNVVSQRLKKAEAALRLQGKLQTGMARQFWKDGGR